MIRLSLLREKLGIKDADYIIQDTEGVYDIIASITPKFSGTWTFAFMYPTIVFVSDMIDHNRIPDFIDATIYLPKSKLEAITLEYPSLTPKKESIWDIYQNMIASLPCLIDPKAAKILYHSVGANPKLLGEALDKLVTDCDTGTITVKQVTNSYQQQKRIYATQLLDDFLSQDRYRWKHYTAYVLDIGENIAYYALYKQIRIALQEKNKYLHNEETDNKLATKYDAPLLCYVYSLFANSSNPSDLIGILSAIDHRNLKMFKSIVEME